MLEMQVASTLGSLKMPGIFKLNNVEISSDNKIPFVSSLWIIKNESISKVPKIFENIPNFFNQLINEISKIFNSPSVYGRAKFYAS